MNNALRFIVFTLTLLNFFSSSLFAQDILSIMGNNNAKLYARINHYDPDRYNLLVERKRVEIIGENQTLDFQGSQWQVTQKARKLEKPGRYQIDVSFICLSGKVDKASVSVDFDFSGWSTDNYVLLPASAYNGNRYPYVQMDYPPFFNNQKQIGLNKPLIMSDGPRLNYRDGYSRIQVRSGAMSLPGIGFYSPENNTGFWLCTSQGNSWGDFGVDIEENKSRAKATITITSPVVREIKTHWLCRMDERFSADLTANYVAGDESRISFIVDFFDCPSIQTLYDQMVSLRIKHYPIPPKPDLIPFSKAYQLIEGNKNRLNWREEGYYGTGTNNNWGQDWQPGWVGGLIMTYALLTDGNTLSRERIVQTMNWLYPKGISPSGLYYDIRHNGEFLSSKYKYPFGTDLALTRKNADAVYYALKQFDLMKKLNIPVREEWWSGNLKALEAQLKIWNKYGQLGQYANQVTGELIIGNTTSAGLFPAALCEAYRQTNEERYLKAASQIAEYYYTNFLVRGLICGGPSDAMQSFDSESSYALLESFTILYELTNDKKWLQIAQEMAHQFSSWIVAYDYRFPKETTYGRMDIRSTGTVYANTQNTTSCGGICTHSGLALLKLYRATGNNYYINLLCDIAHAIPQYMSFKGHEIPGYQEGWISERNSMTDFPPGLGKEMAYSSWAEISMMLTYAELPGVYVIKDTKQVFVLDHVDAIINNSGQLEITNPTTFDAMIKLLTETKQQASQPLGQNSFLNWRQVKVPAGEKVRIKL